MSHQMSATLIAVINFPRLHYTVNSSEVVV